jgi:hypothetical protein
MNQSNISKYKDELVHFISGLLAGFISVTVCNPLDIARTRLNVLVIIISSRMLPAIMVIVISTRISHML